MEQSDPLFVTLTTGAFGLVQVRISVGNTPGATPPQTIEAAPKATAQFNSGLLNRSLLLKFPWQRACFNRYVNAGETG